MNDSFSRKQLSIRLVLLLLWAGIMLWAALTPCPPIPSSELLSWDKLQHAGAYALLAILAGGLFSRLRVLREISWVCAFSAAVLYGGLIEILQESLTEVRRAEWGDLLADAIGALLACAAAKALTLRGSTEVPER